VRFGTQLLVHTWGEIQVTLGASGRSRVVSVIWMTVVASWLLACQSAMAASVSTVDQLRVGKPASTQIARVEPAITPSGVAIAMMLSRTDAGRNAATSVSGGVARVAVDVPSAQRMMTYAQDTQVMADVRPQESSVSGSSSPSLLFSGLALIGLIVHRRMAFRKTPN